MITQNRLKELLLYNSDDGTFVWKIGRSGSSGLGNLAGSIHSKGYKRVQLDGTYYLMHRLAWLYTYGKFPLNTIDHINGVRTDNRISNLREATISENNQNRGMLKNNTSGHKGVSWNKRIKKWEVSIFANGKKHSLGCFDNPEEAAIAYKEAAAKYHREFAGVSI